VNMASDMARWQLAAVARQARVGRQKSQGCAGRREEKTTTTTTTTADAAAAAATTTSIHKLETLAPRIGLALWREIKRRKSPGTPDGASAAAALRPSRESRRRPSGVAPSVSQRRDHPLESGRKCCIGCSAGACLFLSSDKILINLHRVVVLLSLCGGCCPAPFVGQRQRASGEGLFYSSRRACSSAELLARAPTRQADPLKSHPAQLVAKISSAH
jgi:hypothetical protein